MPVSPPNTPRTEIEHHPELTAGNQQIEIFCANMNRTPNSRAFRIRLGFLTIRGVTKDTVRNWENSRSSPDLRALPRVLEFLGCDPRKADESIGGQLLLARQDRGLSEKELAAMLRETILFWTKTSFPIPKALFIARLNLAAS